jgi:hypothetical protein
VAYWAKISQTLQADRMEVREQHSFWKQVQIRNIIWTKIPGSKIAFEFGLNFLGVQTGLEKSDKFLKIHISPDIPDYEFRLAWLYGKTWNFQTSSPWTWFERKWKRVWISIQLNQVHLLLIPSNYKMQHFRLQGNGYNKNYGCYTNEPTSTNKPSQDWAPLVM